MTILPKKKPSSSNKEPRSSSNNPSSSEHSHLEAHSSHQSNQESVNSQNDTGGPHRKRAAIGTSGPSGSSDRCSPHRTNRSKSRNVPPTTSRLSPGPDDQKETGAGGYNSEDEYERSAKGIEYSDELERKFEDKIKKCKGFMINKMKEDGACLFRAVADQIYGDQEMHGVVRKLCMDYMAKNSDHFSQFVTEDFNLYIARKRLDTAHGNHAEIQAMAEMYNRPIEVYQYSLEPINTFYTSSPKGDVTPIRVSYHRNNHYNSMVDPFAATIGVGLGLPQFHPGLAEKNLMRDAVHASEKDAIEQAMLKDKLMATDWEATDEQIHEQIARESYLEWIRNQEKMMKENASGSSGESTVTRAHKLKSPFNTLPSSSSVAGIPNVKSKTNSPVHETENANLCCASDNSETAGPSHRPVPTGGDVAGATASCSIMNDLSPSLFGISQWEDDNDIINQVLALSKQEYLDSLKKSSSSQQQRGDGSGSSNTSSAGGGCAAQSSSSDDH